MAPARWEANQKWQHDSLVLDSGMQWEYRYPNRVLTRCGPAQLHNAKTGEGLAVFGAALDDCVAADFNESGTQLIMGSDSGGVAAFSRRRPEYWWCIAWLWEFWATVVFSVALVWNLWRDARRLNTSWPATDLPGAANGVKA